MVVIHAGIEGMLTSRNILVVDGVAILILRQLLLGIGIGEAGRKTVVPSCLHAYLSSTHAVGIQIGVRQIRQLIFYILEIRSRCRQLVLHLIIIEGCRIVVMALGVFGREIEVVAHFRLQMFVAFHNPDAAHIEVVVFLLQRWGTEAHTITCSQRETAYRGITEIQLRGNMRILAIREIVVAQGSHHLPLIRDAPVILRKYIEGILLAGAIAQIGIHQIVVHIVGTDGQHVAALECVVIEQAEGVLHIAVVTDIQMANLLII